MSRRASVVIPTWNGASLLPPCLEALRAQTCQDFETIVVDNGSRDASLAILAEHYPEVRVIALPRNTGYTGAVNAGIRAARSDIVIAFNNDVEAGPTWIEALLSSLDRHPEVGMAASRIMLHDRRNVFHSAGDLFGRDGIPRNRGVWEEDRGQYDRQEYVFGPCGGAAAYRRALLEDTGPFDERLFMYLEDVDMAWRGQLLGYPCLYEPRAVVYHRLSASGGGTVASYFTGRNTIAVLLKDMPSPLLRRHWQAIVKAQLRIASDALRSWRGQAARARLRGQLAGIPLALKLRRSRAEIQARRRASLDYLESLLV